MKSQPSLLRLLLIAFMSALLCLPPKLLACYDDYEEDEFVGSDCDDSTGCWIDHYDAYYGNDWDGFEYAGSFDETDCSSGDCRPDVCSEGVNPFQVADGNALRKVQDLEVKGAASGKFGFTRHHNTIGRNGLQYFGVGGSWRHNWQFDLVEHPTGENGRPALELVYPSGTRHYFNPLPAGGWAPDALHTEKINQTADGFDIVTGSGARLHFVSQNSPTGVRYEMRALTDAYGVVTALDYNDQGYLTRVTEPAGQQLALSYRSIPFKQGHWTRVGAIQTAPAPGRWAEVTVPSAQQTNSTQYIRLRAQQAGASIDLAEIQFLSPTNAVLHGTFTGTNDQSDAPIASSAFCDGDPSTASLGLRVCLLDLGAPGKSAVGKIRVLAATGKESSLNGAIVEVIQAQDGLQTVLDRVTASDGHTVSYGYQTATEPATGYEFVVLNQAQYGDATQAHYNYGWVKNDPRPILRPLMTEADDPRYDGKAKHIRYAYHDQLGMIHQEINPSTGGVYASLELDPANPDKRTVNYSDLRSVSYVTPKSAKGRPTERTDSLGRKTTFEYADNGAGQLTAKTDHLGRRTTYTRDGANHVLKEQRDTRTTQQNTFDPNGRKLKTIDQFGHETSSERDANGRVTRVHSPNGMVHDFTYDAVGRVVTFSQADGGVHKFAYDAQGRKTSWTNPRGGVTQYGYDDAGRLASVTDSLGRTSRREHNERGQITKLTHSDGTTRQFAYDTYGRKISETDRQGRTTKITYDDLSRVIHQEDYVGRVTTLDYAQLPLGCSSCVLVDHPSRIVLPDGMIIQRLYDSEARMIAQTVAVDTPAQATTTYTYDNDDNLVAVTDSLGHTTRTTYDDQHHRVSQTDSLGRVTQWAYDSRGNLASKTAPDGSVTSYTYDANDRPTSSTDAAGNLTRYTYDAAGNIATTIDATQAKTAYTYEGKLRTATLYADGKRQTWEHDSAGRVSKTTTPDGLDINTAYDAGNRVLATSDSLGRKTTYTYDALGHRTSATDPLGRVTLWTYDAHGNVLTTTLPDGTVTRNTYDAQDHLLTTTDATGATTTCAYDAAGNRTSLTDANGHTYGFTFDALHRKTSIIYPDGSQEKWAYDLAGNQITYTTRAGQIKQTTYDASNQPLSETWSPAGAAPNVAYSYDSAGHLLRADNGQAKLTYTYDELGRIASETTDLSTLVSGLDADTVKYRYDELGRRSDLIYPDRTKVSYAYDARSRLIAIDNNDGGHAPLATYDYDAAGQITKLTRANGIATTYTYDMAGQQTDITHANGGTVLASSRYKFDPLSRRTAQTREDGITESYSYDPTGQLISANYGNASSETFAYDPVGNRTQVGRVIPNAPSSIATYTANSLNQYTQTTLAGLNTPLTYDANGNLANDGKQAYTYNAQNRLISVTSASQVKAEFFYDARNRCVLRKYYTPGSQNQWVLNQTDSRVLTNDLTWNLLAERRLDGTPAGQYLHGLRSDEILLAELATPTAKRDPATYYPLADGLGSTVALVDDKSKVAERFRYDVYGNVQTLTSDLRPLTSGSGYRFLFTGREWLANVSLNDHRNRYYLPRLGRWLSVDPIRLAGGNNLYAYVGNAPTSYLDAAGLCCESEQAAFDAAHAANVAAQQANADAQSALNTAQQDVRDAAAALAATTAAFGAAVIAAVAPCAGVFFTDGATAGPCWTALAAVAAAESAEKAAEYHAGIVSVRYDSANSAAGNAAQAATAASAAESDASFQLGLCRIRNFMPGCPCK